MKTHIEFVRAAIRPPPPVFATAEIGAELEFRGRVRELEAGEKIPGLHYEAYEPMARSELEKILQELGSRHGAEEVWFIHRLEFVPTGEESLYIRIASRHRQAGLAFMGELLDRLKAVVPIWKRPPGPANSP
jgi:molybdopterin synthase catalytic subunit